jgi:hypothetical protein
MAIYGNCTWFLRVSNTRTSSSRTRPSRLPCGEINAMMLFHSRDIFRNARLNRPGSALLCIPRNPNLNPMRIRKSDGSLRNCRKKLTLRYVLAFISMPDELTLSHERGGAARTWIGLSWVLTALCATTGLWWLIRIPSVGKGGILLALAATVMPLFWEKIRVPERMSWIAMLCVLFAVEYRAIDKEKTDAAIEQAESLKKIGDGFNQVLTTQQSSFSQLITTSQANFDKLIREERENFNHITKNSIAAQQRENASFAESLRQQKALLASQTELYEFASDKLIPAADPRHQIAAAQLRLTTSSFS